MLQKYRTFKRQTDYPQWLQERDQPPLQDSVRALAWSPDSIRLASAHVDWAVRLWDPNQAAPAQRLIHGKFIVALAWSPDGARLATGDAKGDTVRIWDVAAGEERTAFGKHMSWPWGIGWSADGRQIASAGADGRVYLWETETGALVDTLFQSPDYDPFYALAWSPDGRYIAAANLHNDVYLWDTTAWDMPTVHRRHQASRTGASLAWCKDCTKLAVVDDDGTVEILDVRGSEPEVYATLPSQSAERNRGRWRAVAWSPDGRTIAHTDGTHHVRIWYEGQPRAPLEAHADEVTALAWSPDGRWLASGDEGGFVHLWAV